MAEPHTTERADTATRSTTADDLLLRGETLGAALRSIAAAAPQARVTFPDLKTSLTTAALLELAQSRARALIHDGVQPGSVVGVLAPAGPDLLVGIFGIALAGAAATVLPMPAGMRDTQQQVRRIERIMHAASMTHLVVDGRLDDMARKLLGTYPGLRITGGPADAPDPDAPAQLPPVAPGDLAVVQFTSGTTTRPRGVVLTHRCVLAALQAILTSGEFSPRDVLVQWMPHHHDMGLFGHLSQILNGADSHVFDAVALLRRPADLLRYLAQHRVTTFTGVNFAYELLIAAATPDVLEGLDLSAWRLAFNGAEPVKATTVRRFAEALAPAGVGPGVMFPVYGMAEATLPVTFPVPGTEPRIITLDGDELGTTGVVRTVAATYPHAKTAVSVGRPVAGISVRLVDDQGELLGDGRLGELQIRGPMVTPGYLGDADATRVLFAGEWLRTGDLGFRLGRDHFVLGRRKEMVIVHGQNYFPDDAETVARETPGVYRQHAVAVAQSDQDEEDHIAVIAETRLTGPARDQLAQDIRRRVVAAVGTPQIRVHLVAPHFLTKTTSGKWQRLLGAARLHEGNCP